MAECGFRPRKTSEEVCVWPTLFRGNVCIKSDKISNVSAILGRKCKMLHEVWYCKNMSNEPLKVT